MKAVARVAAEGVMMCTEIWRIKIKACQKRK